MDPARAPSPADLAWHEDLPRVLRERWADDSVEVSRAEPFGSGHSGFTYAVTITGRANAGRYVIRLSPPNVRIAGPADVGRQGRVMSALHAAGLPVPRILLADSGPALAGRSFALMEMVEGDPFEAVVDRYPAREIAAEAVGFLTRMRSLAPEATGIGGEAPMALGSEIERWAWLLDRAPEWLRDRSLPLRDRLRATLPEGRAARLVHGDYHYGNMLFRGPRLLAVLDWEIAELGDPLLDLGCIAVASLRRRYGSEPNPTGSLAIPVSELADLYGTSIDELGWPVALTCYKYAAILGYNFGLHLSGRRPDPVYLTLTGTMGRLIDDGSRILTDGLAAVDREAGA